MTITPGIYYELDGDMMAAYDWPDYAEELAGIEPRGGANV